MTRHLVSGQSYCAALVNKAVRKGLLPRANTARCADCDSQAQCYDHRNYNHPLAVQPVCRLCNARRKTAIPKIWQRDELLAYLRRHSGPSKWPKRYCRYFIDRFVSDVEHRTGRQITRHDLRPDVYGEAA